MQFMQKHLKYCYTYHRTISSQKLQIKWKFNFSELKLNVEFRRFLIKWSNNNKSIRTIILIWFEWIRYEIRFYWKIWSQSKCRPTVGGSVYLSDKFFSKRVDVSFIRKLLFAEKENI